MGFEDTSIRDKEVVLVCNSVDDEFLLEQASGGISALLDMAWQIYVLSMQDTMDFVVLVHEI